MSSASAGTSRLRIRNVSSSTPTDTTTAFCTDGTSGSTLSEANVAASTTPALVMTPPVTVTACRTPRR